MRILRQFISPARLLSIPNITRELGSGMNPETIYLENLTTIERIAAFVARRSHLGPDEVSEFIQDVRVRMLEEDYAILRKFEGRSAFSTYLTTVIVRLHHQWRVERWGKWRPSAEAQRLGQKAIALERMLTRDGFTFDEAVQVLTTRSGGQFNVAELEAIYLRLPTRVPRPVPVSDEGLLGSVASASNSAERVESRDRERAARLAAKALDDVLEAMEPEDRLLLQLRFWRAQKVPQIAEVLHLEQKKIYKRLDRLCVILRRGLETAGVSRQDVAALLERGDHDVRVNFGGGGGIGVPRPSLLEHSERGGEGRAG
jgi:RNA polymerase sigma factor (sigma-70 family)